MLRDMQDLDRYAAAKGIGIALLLIIGGATLFAIPLSLLLIGVFGGGG